MRKNALSDWQKNMTCLAEWAEQYLDFCQIRFVIKTYDEKKSTFKRFFKEVDATLPVTDLNMTMALQFVQNQFKNRSGYGANKDRKNLLEAGIGELNT